MAAQVKSILSHLFRLIFNFFMSLRYSVEVKGLKELSQEIGKNGRGVLFLPNHPTVLVDPTLVSLAIHKRYPVRPVIVDFMYRLPLVSLLMRIIDAIAMPDFGSGSNTLKLEKVHEALQQVIHGLKKGEVFLFFPAGKVKSSSVEQIGGASGVYRIVQEAENYDIVLVRTTGLWGSHFSRAYTSKTPHLGKTLLVGTKVLLKNLLFFTPRRKVTITFEKAPKDFPVHGTKNEINQALEQWYNKIEDTFVHVPYTRFGKEPQWPEEKKVEKHSKPVDALIKEKVFAKLSEISNVPLQRMREEMNLSADLGIDSLSLVEIAAFLEEDFDVHELQGREILTVQDVLRLASQESFPLPSGELPRGLENWLKAIERKRCELAKGESIIEAFLQKADQDPHRAIAADLTAGVLTYRDIKTRMILLKKLFTNLPGEKVGILLPNSSTALICILACQAAGKIPVMLNWTLGSRHINEVIHITKMESAVSSWAFLEHLSNTDLGQLSPLITQLEDFRKKISIFDKIKAKFLSYLLYKTKLKRKDTAVILFTSGSEGTPKGVPLTHDNVLSNIDSLNRSIELKTDDVLFNFLPPFHSYGFTVSTLCGPLLGMRSPYYPNPNEPHQLAKGVEIFKGTILCGAPTFLKRILTVASPKQLKSLRLIVTGAEKAPQELYELARGLKNENRVVEGYGITECSPVLTLNRSEDDTKGVGRPIEGVEMAIIDHETHAPLGPEKTGLVLVRGPNVFPGYITQNISPFLTHQGKIWYQTGDLGFLDEKGRLTLTGRLKRFVKVGGEMISLGGLEEVLSEKYPLKEEGPLFAVSAKEREGDRPRLILFTTLPLSLDEANHVLKSSGVSNLARFALVYKLPQIPLLGTGKVNYKKLEEEYFV
jgi:long-chain-fatty-acid--[acyl-carrier-protein] ligase